MKVFSLALVFFLLAFAGLAAGLLLRRKGLRGGCGSHAGSLDSCKCRTDAKPVMTITVNPSVKKDDA